MQLVRLLTTSLCTVKGCQSEVGEKAGGRDFGQLLGSEYHWIDTKIPLLIKSYLWHQMLILCIKAAQESMSQVHPVSDCQPRKHGYNFSVRQYYCRQ